MALGEYEPEATPEPGCWPMLPSRTSRADVLNGIDTLEGLLAGCPSCTTCVFGVSKPVGRASVGGRAVIEPDNSEKACIGIGDVAEVRERLRQEGIFMACRKGLKPQQPNQDNMFFLRSGRFCACGVADGHGEAGHWVSHWAVRAVIRQMLVALEGADALPADEFFNELFDVAHYIVGQKAQESAGFDVHLSGTTLSVAVVDAQTQNAVAAWAGDSRVVCGRRGWRGAAETVMCTSDHKANEAEERRRIVASGGEVLRLPNDIPFRVFLNGREAPGLAMSRSVGDTMAHDAGVIHVPGVKRFQLEEGSVLLCCSDGVWEFIKSLDAVRACTRKGPEGVAEAVAWLAQDSRERWLKEEGNVTDDITAVAVWGTPLAGA